MRPISRRHKLLGVALGVVAIGWLVDILAGGGKPAVVRAAVGVESPPTAGLAAPSELPDLDEFLRTVEEAPTTLPELELDQLTRDPFVPTTVLRTACSDAEPASTEESAEATEESAGGVPFEQRHQLQGILTGRVPLAVIDGELYPVGAQLEGYRLMRIERDCVVWQQGDRQVALRLGDAGE